MRLLSESNIVDMTSATLKLNRMQVRQRPAQGGEKKPPQDVPRGHSLPLLPPQDVPRGHLAVVVGEARRRFVVRTDFLNHPVLRQLLDQAYEEYGHANPGPLAIPCDEFLIEDIVHSLRGCTRTNQLSCPFIAF